MGIIVETVKELDRETSKILEAFKELDKEIKRDFPSMLSESVIIFTVSNLGVEWTKPFLSIPYVKFSNLSPRVVASIIINHGIESIKSISETDLKFSKLPPYSIAAIVEGLGIQSIKPLKDVGANFTAMTDYQNNYIKKAYDKGLVSVVVETLGIDSIKPLAEAGVRFQDFDVSEVKPIVKKLGTDSIQVLLNAGVQPDVMQEVTDIHHSDIADSNMAHNIAVTKLADITGIVGTQISVGAGIVGTQVSVGAYHYLHNLEGPKLSSGADITKMATYVADDAAIMAANGVTLDNMAGMAANKIGTQLSPSAAPYSKLDLAYEDDEENEEESNDHAPELAPHHSIMDGEL